MPNVNWISSMNIRIQLIHVMGNVVSLPHAKYFFHKTRLEAIKSFIYFNTKTFQSV